MKGLPSPQFQPNVCLLSLKQWDKYHFRPIYDLTWKRGVVGLPLFVAIFMCQVCSTSTNYVTLPSMWPPRGLNLPSCHKVKSYLCIYTTSYLRVIHIATKKHNIITYFGLLSFSIVNRLKAILLSVNASYVNYLTVPLQRYSLHSFLLSHWEGLLVLVLLWLAVVQEASRSSSIHDPLLI